MINTCLVDKKLLMFGKAKVRCDFFMIKVSPVELITCTFILQIFSAANIVLLMSYFDIVNF
jgi:hypothetical protein